ncbi:MAG TPA: FkbM family methyltransferase [Acetobacteraceae bacterium]|nr:FkbM family methyltransferase [Acetobacteraceae bacterium]
MPEIATRYGRLSVPDTASDMIGRFLLRYGEWAQLEIRFVASAICSPAARICDIGAFVGTFGLGLAQLRSLSGLVFVEPNAIVTPMLRANARLARGIEPIVVEAAIGVPADANVASYDPGNLGSFSFALPAGGGRVTAVSSVPSIGLGQLRREHGPFDLVKIDAEGLETSILAGDTEGLSEEDCSYWIACDETPDSLEVCRLLLGAGLRLQYFAYPSFSPSNFLRDPEPIYPYAYEAGLWASREAPAQLDPALADEGCLLVPITQVEDLRLALWRTPRFGLPEWQGQPAPVLAALAGRALRGEDWETFPAAEAPPLNSVARLRGRIAEVEAALAAERVAFSTRVAEADAAIAAERSAKAALQAELEAAREVEERATRIHAAAEILVADAQERALRSEDLQRAAESRAVLLNAEARSAEAQANSAEARAISAEARLEIAEATVAAIANSTTWRVTGALRTRLAARPRLARFLKAVLRPFWRLARGTRRHESTGSASR